MTAVNCFVTADAVHISTDGSRYLMDGQIVGQAQKVAIVGHLPCVVAIRGPAMFAFTIGADLCAKFTTFDQLVPHLSEFIKEAWDQYRWEIIARGLDESASRVGEFVIAGWSEDRDGPEAYLLQSHAGNGFECWAAYPITDALISPHDQIVTDGIGDILADIGTFDTNPAAASLRIMELQHRPFDMGDGRACVPIGAFCQLTTITREGITTKILKRWPDQVAA